MILKLKQIFKLVFLHSGFFAVGTIFFIFTFRTSIFSSLTVYFYRGIALLLLTSFLMVLLLIYFKNSKYGTKFSYYDVILSIVILFSFNLLFFTHVPVTADRSISIFLLSYMNNNSEKVITETEMQNFFVEKYLNENNNLDKRFKEQLFSGNIKISNDGFQISERGKILMKFYKVVADLFQINRKNLSP